MSYNFLLKIGPLLLGLVFVVSLFICLITWLDYFSQFYIPYSGKLMVLFLQPWVYVHGHSGTSSFPALSIKLLSLLVITARYGTPLIAR